MASTSVAKPTTDQPAAAPEGWDSPSNVTEAMRKMGGASWARGYIERARKNKPNSRDLAFYVDGAREILFKDDPGQQAEFFNALRDAIVECRTETVTMPDPRLSLIEEVLRYLREIVSIADAIKTLTAQDVADGGGGEEGALGVGVQVLAEKAGYLADKCITMVDGGPACIGDFDAWAGLNRNVPTAPEEEAASA